MRQKKMIKKYKKRPVVIEAVKFVYGGEDSTVELIREWAKGNIGDVSKVKSMDAKAEMQIITLEDGKDKQVKHIATEGDYIIKGVQGEFYPCKPDIFMETYEEVE